MKKVTLTKKNWNIIVDKFIGIKYSDFYDTKNGMIEPTFKCFKKWKQNGQPVNIVGYGSADKNTKLENTENSRALKLNL